MSTLNKNALRRLRLLQFLAMAGGEWLAAETLLRLALEDPDLAPDMTRVLRSLIWLEDVGLAETRTVDIGDDAVVFSRVAHEGIEYLGGDRQVTGIYHPEELLEVCRGA